jgi:integrase
VLAYAIAAQYRKREDGNPARWDGHLQELLGSKSKAQQAKRERTGKSEHHRALPYQEIPALMAELRARDALSARALEFTVLTVARTSEVIDATWAEFDLLAKTWTVPAERMKKGKEHKVPLPDRAIEILRGLKHHSARLFPLSNRAMLELLWGMRSRYTVHGMRSCFRGWAGDRTSYDRETIEFCLAHDITDKTEAAYRRSASLEKRRRLLRAWSDFCAKPAVFAPAEVVKPLRAARTATNV